MNTFEGKHICIERDGMKIFDTTQANPDDKKCPEGFKACSPKTKNWYDIVCISDKEDSKERCPILRTKFVTNSKVNELSDEWNHAPFNEALSFAWTKTDSVAGPLEQTFVGLQPCTDPKIKLAHPAKYIYFLELKEDIKICTLNIKKVPT